jgi:hypothetical protein
VQILIVMPFEVCSQDLDPEIDLDPEEDLDPDEDELGDNIEPIFIVL